MWLESSQLHTLLTYQTDLGTIAVVLVEVMGHVPIFMQQLHMLEVLLEFSLDVGLNDICEALMDTKH